MLSFRFVLHSYDPKHSTIKLLRNEIRNHHDVSISVAKWRRGVGMCVRLFNVDYQPSVKNLPRALYREYRVGWEAIKCLLY